MKRTKGEVVKFINIEFC